MIRKAPAAATAETSPVDDSAPATPAGVVASGAKECGMTEDTWSGLPHWSCRSCGFETLVKTEADRHRKACSAKSGD